MRVLIKRDDLTGLVFGGNKTRKFDLSLAEAMAGNPRKFVWQNGQGI